MILKQSFISSPNGFNGSTTFVGLHSIFKNELYSKTVNNLQKVKQCNALSGGISVGPKKEHFSQLGLMLKPINWFFAHFVCVLYPKNNLLLIELKFYLTFKF